MHRLTPSAWSSLRCCPASPPRRRSPASPAQPGVEEGGHRHAAWRQAGSARARRLLHVERAHSVPPPRSPVTAHILKGAFTLELEGRAPETITAGQAYVVH